MYPLPLTDSNGDTVIEDSGDLEAGHSNRAVDEDVRIDESVEPVEVEDVPREGTREIRKRLRNSIKSKLSDLAR